MSTSHCVPACRVQANSVFGALRALESLAQLVRRRAVAEVEAGPELAGAVPDDALWQGEPLEQGRRSAAAGWLRPSRGSQVQLAPA